MHGYMHPSIGLNHVNGMLNQKPACLTGKPFCTQQNSHVGSLLDSPGIEHIDKFIGITNPMEITLHVHEKPEYAAC